MNSPEPIHFPAIDICEKARLSRDARFDGIFFTAVLSTGIYCRPVCPARPPKAANVVYYPSAAAAEGAGFRPCLRCRPELAPGNRIGCSGEQRVARGLRLIDEGFLAEHSLQDLATRLDIGARQLRRLFVEHLGAPPMAVHATRRLLFAKQLLTETALPITEVALAAGFQSLRRFNAAFAQANHAPPRELRRRPLAHGGTALVLRLGYRPPYDFEGLLGFLRDRALPGVEFVESHSYQRVFNLEGTPGWLRVSRWPGATDSLRLELQGVAAQHLLGLVARVRRMFDLDAQPQAIATALGASPVLAPLVERYPGLRLPGGWDGFEIAVRAVLGQQVSVAAARTLASRLVQRYGQALPVPYGAGLERLFPGPEHLLEADLTALGITRARAATIQGIARALLDGRLELAGEQRLEAFVESWVALPGIGAWTAHYMAMRVLNHPDAFPAADLVLRRVAAGAHEPLTPRALEHLAEHWRPWRAYAVMYLWRAASAMVTQRKTRT